MYFFLSFYRDKRVSNYVKFRKSHLLISGSPEWYSLSEWQIFSMQCIYVDILKTYNLYSSTVWTILNTPKGVTYIKQKKCVVCVLEFSNGTNGKFYIVDPVKTRCPRINVVEFFVFHPVKIKAILYKNNIVGSVFISFYLEYLMCCMIANCVMYCLFISMLF